MNTRFKVFASYNILQNMYDFIHVLIFVTLSKCQKSPKLTNIVIDEKKFNVFDTSLEHEDQLISLILNIQKIWFI